MASQTLVEMLKTYMPIVGDQSMKERVVRVEVMMDRGCKSFKDVLGRKDVNISKSQAKVLKERIN